MNNNRLYFAVVSLICAAIPLGFAESFPNRPTAGELGVIVEQGITCGNAVRERGLAVNDSVNFLPYCGHGQSYLASLQQELESLTPSYIDYLNGPLNPAGTDFLYFTLATWREVAELNEDGFQRFDSDGNFIGYGIAQSNDGILPTVFDELQTGFGALKWSMRISYVNLYNFLGASGTGGNCEENKTLFDADLASATWGSDDYGGWVYYADFSQESSTHWHCGRIRGKARIVNLPSILHSADIYLLPVKHPEGPEFYDFDSLGLTENVFKFYASLGESSDTSHIQTNYVGNTKANGFDIIGWTCPAQGRHRFCGFNGSYWLLKWNFTDE